MTNDQLDALLDASLDSLDDMPELKPFPAGVHKVKMNMAAKLINDKPCISVDFTYQEPVEFGDPTVEAPKAGDKSNILCTLGNEFGEGTFKKVAAVVVSACGLDMGASRRALIEACKDVEVVITTTLRKGKDDAVFLNLKDISVA